MRILVFVKRVPDTESRIRLDAAGKAVSEDGLNFIISPYDEYAVEEALRLKAALGGEVTAVTAGREEDLPVLRKCLAMGADSALLIRDDAPETYDGLRTAKMFAAVVRHRFPDAGLLLFGRRSAGADNGQVPSMTAALLGLPQVTDVIKLEATDGRAVAWREVEGAMQRNEVSFPAVLSAQKGLNEPRYETLKGIMGAKKAAIPQVTPEDLGLGAAETAPAVSVKGLDFPKAKAAGRVLQGSPSEAARELVRLLRDEARVI